MGMFLEKAGTSLPNMTELKHFFYLLLTLCDTICTVVNRQDLIQSAIPVNQFTNIHRPLVHHKLKHFFVQYKLHGIAIRGDKYIR